MSSDFRAPSSLSKGRPLTNFSCKMVAIENNLVAEKKNCHINRRTLRVALPAFASLIIRPNKYRFFLLFFPSNLFVAIWRLSPKFQSKLYFLPAMATKTVATQSAGLFEIPFLGPLSYLATTVYGSFGNMVHQIAAWRKQVFIHHETKFSSFRTCSYLCFVTDNSQEGVNHVTDEECPSVSQTFRKIF